MLSSLIAAKRPSVEQAFLPSLPFSHWLPRLTFVLWCSWPPGKSCSKLKLKR